MTTQDGSVDVLNQIQQGGSLWSVGGQIDIAAGGAFSRSGINETLGVTITYAKGGSANICLVSFQLVDANGAAVANQEVLDIYLSDSATGVALTATTASGAVGAGASGTDLLVRTAKKETVSLTTGAGLYILSITDTAKTGFYPCVMRGSQLLVGAQLTSANYD